MANAGFWTGMNRATENAGAVGMNVLEFKGRQEDRAAALGIAKDRLDIERDQNERMKVKQQYELDELERKKNEDRAVVPATSQNAKFHEFPEQKKFALQVGRAAGYKFDESPDGEVYGPVAGWKFIASRVKSGNEDTKTFIESGRLDLQNKALALTQQIVSLQESGKSDEKTMQTIADLEKKLMGLRMQIGKVIQMSEDVQKQIEINNAKPDTKDHLRVVGHQVLDVSDPKNPKVVHTAPYAPTGEGGSNKPPAGYRWKPDGSLEAIPGGPATKPKEASLPYKRLDEMVKAAGSNPDPSAIEIIGRLADEHGMEYTEVETPGKIYGTNKEWRLVKKGGGQVQGQEVDEKTATAILKEAGGDKDKARQIAKSRGLKF